MATLQGKFTDTAIVAANGKATVTIRSTNTVIWTVSQVTAELIPQPAGDPIPAGAECYLRQNNYLITPMIPDADAAGGDPPIQLLPSDVLTVEWSGCTPGHICRVLAIYNVSEF